MMPHIGIAAPVATENVAEFLTGDIKSLPKGYIGAPITGVLIGELLKLGYKVSAFTTDTSLYPGSGIVKAAGENFDLYICPERRRAWRFNRFRLGRAIDGFAYERNLLTKTIIAAKPDIIHAHWTYEFALAALKTGLPHLITCHDAPAVILRFNPYPYRAIRYLMARWVFHNGRNFSTVSDYMRKELERYTKSGIALAPNPLAAYVLESGRVRNGTDTRKIGLISNGWDRRKNQKPGLLAFAEFRKLNPTAELHLFGHGVGSGEAGETWCKQQAIADGMIFHGSLPHKQIVSNLDNLDLLLHPALEESFGVVLAEAMALGLPIVAGRHSGAVPWVVGGGGTEGQPSCAVLTDVSSPEAILAAIIEVFDELYPARSAAGYARARQLFAPAKVIQDYIRLYKEISRSAFGIET